MVKIASPITAAWSRAAERAAQDRLAGRIPERIAPKLYRVASSTGGDAHTVSIGSVVNLQATCDCLAGQRGIACRHAAAALCEAARHIAAQEHGHPTGVSAAPQAAPAALRKIGVAYNIRIPQADSASANDRKMARFGRQ